MGQYVTKHRATDQQGEKIDLARRAVVNLAKALKATTGESLTNVRAALDIKNTGTFDRTFKAGEAADFKKVALQARCKIEELQGSPHWKAACEQCQPQAAMALQALDDVLVEFGEMSNPVPGAGSTFAPFEPIDENLAEFVRVASAVHPLPQPSFDDFKAGRITDRRAEAVFNRLLEERLCYLKGTASFGKTTTAMVAAFRHMSRGLKGVYLDLGQIHDDGQGEVRNAFVRMLANGKNRIILLDNAHRQPALVRRLQLEWEQIHPMAMRPLLLVVGTAIAYSATTMAQFRMEWPASTIEAALGAENFGDIARFYLLRANNSFVVPAEGLDFWAKQFGNHLHAFCFALLNKVSVLGKASGSEAWRLERADALHWITEHWLMKRVRGRLEDIELIERENLFCLCSFAEQDLELSVEAEALPDRVHAPFTFYRDLGVANERGLTRKGSVAYGLMEHGWGALILEAAGVSPARALELQSEAIKRLPRLGLRTIARLEITSPDKRDILIDQIDRIGWKEVTDRSTISLLAGYAAAIVKPRPGALAKLRTAVISRAEKDIPFIADADFGQLCYLIELLQPFDAKAGATSGLIQAVQDHSLPENCSLYVSAGQRVRGNQLRWISRLDPASPLRAGLANAIEPALKPSLDAELDGLRLESVTDLLDGIYRGLEEKFDMVVETMLEEPRKEKLGQLVDAAVPHEFHYLLSLDRGRVVQDPRIVELFFARLKESDWSSRIPADRGGAKGAVFLAKTLAGMGMIDEAADLADIVVGRADEWDFGWVTSVDQIGLIAGACRYCRSAVDARAYFEKMQPVIARNLKNESISKSKMAGELGAMAQCDVIDPSDASLESAARLRAFHGLGLRPGEELDEKGVGEYVRLAGSLASCWRLGIFQYRFSAFLDVVGIAGVLANPAMWPPDDRNDGYVPLHQMQFWQGLWALSRTKGASLPVDRDRLLAIRDLWDGNLEFTAQPLNAGAKARHRLQTIVSWIDASLTAGGTRLVPATGSLVLLVG